MAQVNKQCCIVMKAGRRHTCLHPIQLLWALSAQGLLTKEPNIGWRGSIEQHYKIVQRYTGQTHGVRL